MIHNPLSIAGKNIVITGAASGIGRQCAIDFSYSGANLILLDINEEELAATKDLCNKDVCCNYYKCDLTDASLLKTVVDTMVIENGPVDGMLYAAGIEKTLPYNHLSETDYSRIYSVNVVAAMSLLNLLTKKKYRGEHSKYVLISSITSVVGRPGGFKRSYSVACKNTGTGNGLQRDDNQLYFSRNYIDTSYAEDAGFFDRRTARRTEKWFSAWLGEAQ